MIKVCVLAASAACWSLAASVLVPSLTESAVANGDTRTLHLYHTHTGETIDATFRVDGHYDAGVLRQLNHFLRDWRNNDETSMDPRLFDAVWEAYRSAGATERVQIYSAYRSPETNAMLRRRSRAVAEHSQHMLGKAMDTTMPGFPMSRVREAGMRLQNGGVGWYPSANFVHLDVGSVRSWPRMSYEQLASIFPDGKTVHIASNGQTLPGYDAARQEIAARGNEAPPAQESGGFFAWLFGGGGNTAGAAREDEEDRRTPKVDPAQVARQEQAARQQEAARQEQAARQQEAARQEQAAQQVARGQEAARQEQALAYAGSTSRTNQPLETIPQVDAQGESRRQVASLETTADDKPTAVAVMPLPPRRPATLAAAVEIPLPPVRPDAFTRLESASIRFSDASSRRNDPIASLITATSSGVPMIRKSRLPAIITQGTGERRRLPNQALSFVESDLIESAPKLDMADLDASSSSSLRPVGLRAAAVRRGLQAHASGQAPRQSPPPVAAAKLTGLRKAAHMMAQKAAL